MLPPLIVKLLAKSNLSEMMKGASASVDKAGKKMRGAGKKLSLGLSLPLGLAGIAAFKMSNDFNASMANVATLIPGNQKRIQELKKEVQKLAIEGDKSTGDIAQGLFQTISAFGDGADTMEKLRANARGAVAGVSTVGDAINLTSLVTKAYGDTSVVTTQKILDLAFKANELGQTTFPEMAASLGKAVPFSQALGVSFEELFGVMGTFTGVTGNTSEVTTQLTSFLSALMKPTGDMEIAFRKLGVQSGKELIRTKGLKGAMQALVDITKPYPGVLAKVLGRKEALGLVLSATSAQAETFAQKMEKMKNVTGAAETAFREQTDGINKNGFALKQFTTKLSVLGQKMGDIIGVYLTPFINKLGKLTDKFNALSPSNQKLIVVFGTILALLPPLIGLMGTLAFMVTAVSWPVLLVVAALALMAAGIAFLVIKWDTWGTTIKLIAGLFLFLLGPIGLIIGAVALLIKYWDKITGKFTAAIGIIKKVGSTIKSVFGSGGPNIDFSGKDRLDAAVGKNRSSQIINNNAQASRKKEDAKVTLEFDNMPAGMKVKTSDLSDLLNLPNGLMTAGGT